MKKHYMDYEHRLMDGLTTAKKHCKCGHTQLVPRLKGRDYILCSWCHGRMYYDEAKQKEYDRKCRFDEFRYNVTKYIVNSECEVRYNE